MSSDEGSGDERGQIATGISELSESTSYSYRPST